MHKKSKILKRAYDFWHSGVKKKDYIVKGTDFPDEYTRKVLLRKDLAFLVKRGVYLLKDTGDEAQNLIYQLYWQIVEKLLMPYQPCSIEKESAINLHLGNESIPKTLFVRTLRNVKYSFLIAFGLKIRIRPDPVMHDKTRQKHKIGKTELFIDIPEKVLFSIKKRKGINFIAFLKGIKFDKRILEILYSANPKPIVVSELIGIARKNGRNDLSEVLKSIQKEYTIYRFKGIRK